MRSRGLSMVELLMVIALLGLLMAVAVPNLARWRASTATAEGAGQFAQAIQKARADAKRTNTCRQVSLVGNAGGTTQYQVSEYSGAACSASSGTLLGTRTYSMPASTLLVLTSATNGLDFVPPYGTTDSVPDSFEVRWAGNAAVKRRVRVTSVFGKVVIQ